MDVYIVAAKRTAIGSFQGQLSSIHPAELGGTVIRCCLEYAGIKPNDICEVIIGQVMTAGQGPNCARQAAILAEIPMHVPAHTTNMNCGSGLKAICLGYQAIRSGDSNIVVCGGQENMSRANHVTYIRSGNKLGNNELKDSIIFDGLLDPHINMLMGETAEFLAQTFHVSREVQDEFACSSQNKTSLAQKEGHFDLEITPVILKKLPPFTVDEFPKPDTTIERLATLRSAFEKDPTKNPSVTAGNSSGINDGAAAVILCSGLELQSRNLTPLAKIIAVAQAGVEPIEMGLGPVPAVRKILRKAGWKKDEVDLYEINEAFAVQTFLVIDQLELPVDKVNISGGGIALGHPVGASGARVLVTLVHNLLRLKKKRGVAALCVGGGMGIAVAIEACIPDAERSSA